MINLDAAVRRAAITAAVEDLQVHRSTAYTERLVRLLDALIEDTLFDLATAAAELLPVKQGALAQLRALRTAVMGTDAHVSPKAHV